MQRANPTAVFDNGNWLQVTTGGTGIDNLHTPEESGYLNYSTTCGQVLSANLSDVSYFTCYAEG
jgi:hypothetical protein